MIELPDKFKQALGNGVRTSLYPLVRIYKGIRIDEPLENATEVINLSIKETNIDGSAYKPLLLNAPSIRNSADIINNKYTISSVSLSISNAPFQGKIFSDDIQSLLNAVCEVYYCANGIDSLDDSLLVYTGTIRRFNQSAETIKLELEDLTQQMLSTQIPASTVPDEEFYKEDDIGKPYPMVYGFVDKSPVIPRSEGTDNMGELKEQLTKFHIDKRGKEIEGLWTFPNSEDYGNPFLNNNHPLITEGYIKEAGTLSVYENNFIPIPQYLNYTQPWTYYLNGITDPDDEDYKKITFSVENVYEFQQSNGFDSSASIKVNSETLINEEGVVGLPTRVYRPIDKVECFTFNDFSTQDIASINKIYGFTGYDINSSGDWRPWEWDDSGIEGSSGYYDNWHGNGDQTWWQPTECNLNENFGVTSSVDEYWKESELLNSNGLFPVDRLQNGNTSEGMYLAGRNVEGPRGQGNRSGMCHIKLIFKDNIANFPCSSKYVYDAQYHSFSGMGTSSSGNLKSIYPARFWVDESTPIFKQPDVYFTAASSLIGRYEFPNVGNTDFEHISYEGQNGTEDSIQKITGFGESNSWTETNSFNNIKFGIQQYGQQGSTVGNDRGYSAVQLFNIYLLQDAVIDQPLDKEFFADVKGRVQDNEVIVSAQNIFKDILEDELNYQQGNVQTIDEIDDWQYSFTLNEQKEAKEVFEELFKSSLIIPSFNAKGQFTFIPLHQVLDDVLYTTIDNQDILKYSFSLTKLDDIKNQINVKYKKNYGSGEFDKQTGYSIIDSNGNEFETYDEITQSMYPNDESKHYNIDYYGLTSEEAKLEIETEYIRDEVTARKLQKRLLSWYANQHLITKIDLPVTYMNLEVGDYIYFNELIGGKLAFGFDYTVSQIRNGQVVYPLFFINKISKSLDKVSIEAVQVHRGEYGSAPIVNEEETENIVDSGGNDGQGNFDLPDPSDNANYGDNTTAEEETEEEIEEYLNCNWYQESNNLNNNPQIILDTNIEGEFICEVLITSNDEEILHPNTQEVLIPIVQNSEYDASNYINILKTEYTDAEGNVQGGIIQLSTLYLIPEGHNGIEGIVKVFYQGTSYSVELNFTQNYVEPPQPILGDVNNDGILNVADIILLADVIRRGSQFQQNFLQQNPQADLNQDGILNISDILLLVNLIIGQGNNESSL